MNQGKYVFAQIVEFLPQRIFDRIVEKYEGNKYVRHFTCWNQLLCMLFGQLTNRDSLRDLMVALKAHSNKSYHLGFGKTLQGAIWLKPMNREIAKYLKSLLITLLANSKEFIFSKGIQINFEELNFMMNKPIEHSFT